MLDDKELRVVLTTLTTRRDWLIKTLDSPQLSTPQREEQAQTIRLLENSLLKLARAHGKAKPPTGGTAKSLTPVRRPIREQTVAVEDAYVLVAEDNPESRELLRGALEDLGVTQIDVADNGVKALFALQKCSPAYDVVLLDWEMPEMNGLEVYKTVRTLAKLESTHFLMVTAVSDGERIRQAIQEGIDGYLVKPIDLDNLENKLKEALAGDAPTTKEPPAIKQQAAD